MTNWPFSKRRPASRVVVKVNCVSVQCWTESTRSLPNAAKRVSNIRVLSGRAFYRGVFAVVALLRYALIILRHMSWNLGRAGMDRLLS